MISDVLMSSFSKEEHFMDHLFENKILDIDEPQYENGDILRELMLKKTTNVNGIDTIAENSVTSIFVPAKKEQNEENIYENVGFIQNCLNVNGSNSPAHEDLKSSPSESKNNFHESKVTAQNSGIYRSTLSFSIGESNGSALMKKSVNSNCSDSVFLPDKETNAVKSDDASFKSSYAKSLIDSYRKNSTSPIQNCYNGPLSSTGTSSPSSNCDITFKSYESLSNVSPQNNSFRSADKVHNSSPCSLPGFQKKSYDDSHSVLRISPNSQLEMKLSNLNDDLKHKDSQQDQLRRELNALQLDYSRLKAENRSLKLNQSFSQRSFSMGDSQPTSLSSMSADSDTWTLQQQVIALKSQLEKAELSRHAYESATKQLIHFLETIKSTLSVADTTTPTCPELSPAVLQPLNTSELISNLENSLVSNGVKTTRKPKPWFDSNRNGSYLSDVDDDNSRRRRRRKSVDPVSSSSSSSNGSKKCSSNRDKKSHLKSSSSAKLKADNSSSKTFRSKEAPESDSLLRQQQLKKSLLRSGSVNDISCNVVSPVPRVTRAVSSQCVSRVQSLEDSNPPPTTSSPTNRLFASKAKTFFSSLKNIFKSESSTNSTIGERCSSEFRKKLTLPIRNRSSSVSVKKSHSLKKENGRIEAAELSKMDHNSIFYVPSLPPTGELEVHDKSPSSPSCSCDSMLGCDCISDKDSIASPLHHLVNNEEMMSGPQELSISLSIQDSGYVTPPMSDDGVITKF